MSTVHASGTAAGPVTTRNAPGIDPRGPRFAAAVTLVVLAVALLAAPSATAVVLVAVQTAVFAVGAARGPQHTPYSWAFRTFVRPRLDEPATLEDPAPPRFAQTVGLAFTGVGLLSYLAGATTAGSVATGLAVAAAFLNAVFGLCLGCELYLLGRRVMPARRASPGA